MQGQYQTLKPQTVYIAPKTPCMAKTRTNSLKCRFPILLTYIITNPNSKTENYTCIQTSFCVVNTNNASSGLRENVTLTNLAPKIWLENMAEKQLINERVRSINYTLDMLKKRDTCRNKLATVFNMDQNCSVNVWNLGTKLSRQST